MDNKANLVVNKKRRDFNIAKMSSNVATSVWLALLTTTFSALLCEPLLPISCSISFPMIFDS